MRHVPHACLPCRLSSTRATLIALFCTFSEAFDVPVYWPILMIYFFVLFALTMRRQIQCVFTFIWRESRRLERPIFSFVMSVFFEMRS
jgi:Rer1 family